MPRAVDGWGPLEERKSVEGNSGAVDADSIGIGAEMDQSRCKGFAAGEDHRERANELRELAIVAGLVGTRHDVHAVERHDGRVRPVSDEWQQVHAGVAEVDVQEIRLPSAENAGELIIFAAVKDRLHAADVFLVEPCEKIDARARQEFDGVEGELLPALSLLRHHECFVTPQSRDLPVNVQHLRFEERGAVAGDDRHGESRDDTKPFGTRTMRFC